jgi:hypothetical protein
MQAEDSCAMEPLNHTPMHVGAQQLPTRSTCHQQQQPERPQPCRWMACCYRKGRLGVAAYDKLTNEARHLHLAAQCSRARHSTAQHSTNVGLLLIPLQGFAPHPPSPPLPASLQLSVMEVEDDSRGACAFRMLRYAKMLANPEVLLLSADADSALKAAASAPHDISTADCGSEVDIEAQLLQSHMVQGQHNSSGGPTVLLQRASLFSYNNVRGSTHTHSTHARSKHSMHMQCCAQACAIGNRVCICACMTMSTVGAFVVTLITKTC